MNDGLAIGNHKDPSGIEETLKRRHLEVTACLKRCYLDGCSSPRHIRFELNRALDVPAVCNMTDEHLMDILKRVFGWPNVIEAAVKKDTELFIKERSKR